jgi:Uma2 family endonuclease
MATTFREVPLTAEDYPASDGRPMGETPLHVDNLAYLVQMLKTHYANDPNVFVAGNMFVYYVPGNRLRHVSPDVFVVFGIPKSTTPERRRYLVWENGKAPDVAIELTSESTREEDIDDKMVIYRNMGVREYFLFDPYAEYLDPPLQGYRLVEGEYQRIAEVSGRLPSEILGLHLEPSEGFLRLYNPSTQTWLLTPPEEHAALVEAMSTLQEAEAERRKAEAERHKAEAERRKAEAERLHEEQGRRSAEAEVARLQQQLEELRRQLPSK